MYVGMNRPGSGAAGDIYCVPHVRGDEPRGTTPIAGTVVGSPCTWGRTALIRRNISN